MSRGVFPLQIEGVSATVATLTPNSQRRRQKSLGKRDDVLRNCSLTVRHCGRDSPRLRARTHTLTHTTHSTQFWRSNLASFTFIVLAFYFCPTESDQSGCGARLCWVQGWSVHCGRVTGRPPGARALLTRAHMATPRSPLVVSDVRLPNAFTRREWQSLGPSESNFTTPVRSRGGAGGGRAGMRGSCANSLTLTPTDQLMSHEPRTGHERLLVYRVIR